MVAHEEQLLAGGEELHPDPVVLELNRLQNQFKEKERELGAAQAKIKALKATEALRDKTVEELRNEVHKLDDKLRVNENVLEQKNLEIKKLTNEKKDAFAAQLAAEATLRRVYADQKDDDDLPLESVIAPLESEIKMLRNEIATLQEDKKALERLTKSKEAALLQAERILKSALERVLIVEEVQNQNFELRRQIEICQEENKILEKSNRQKVLEVEKLSQTIKELEEAILAGGAAANAVRDYRRQVSELQDEKRTLERELARVKVSANRVATVVANEWKDENGKVMPVKQWLEERRLLQAEMQRLKDKLALSERTAKAEAQLKDKFKLRLKTLEEGLKQAPSLPINNNPNAFCGSPTPERSSNILGFLTSNGGHKKRSTSQPRGSTITRNSLVQQLGEKEAGNANGDTKQASNLNKKHASAEVMPKKGLWAPMSKFIDSSEKENTELKANTDTDVGRNSNAEGNHAETKNKGFRNEDSNANAENEDVVSGFLYDRLQKEVINLRKWSEAKDSSLEAKDQEIKLLVKKVEAVTRAMEVESRKVKREAAAREKEAGLAKMEETKIIRNMVSTKRVTKMP